jgi:hypothetical protein
VVVLYAADGHQVGRARVGVALSDGAVSIGAILSGAGTPASDIDRTGWPIIQTVVRWLPGRAIVFVADSRFAVIDLLHRVSRLRGASLITRLRLDAALYDLAPAPKPRQKGRPRLKVARRPRPKTVLADPLTQWMKLTVEHWYGDGLRQVEVCTDTAIGYHTGLPPVAIRWVLIGDPLQEFEPQALLWTNLQHTPHQMLTWFVRRWTMEVTMEEARAHLGLETQRQWSDLAMARTTPALFALFSLVTLTAQARIKTDTTVIRTAAWYAKTQPTFSDAIAWVRRQLWCHRYFSTSDQNTDRIKIPRSLFERLTDAVCYAA